MAAMVVEVIWFPISFLSYLSKKHLSIDICGFTRTATSRLSFHHTLAKCGNYKNFKNGNSKVVELSRFARDYLLKTLSQSFNKYMV